MKKIVLILFAALMLSGVACSQNKTESVPEVPDIPGLAEDISAEREFLTLTEADFTKVDLNLTVSDSAPPAELHTIDLDSLDFGQKMSPCKAEDVRSDYFPAVYYGNIEIQEQYEQQFNQKCEKPAGGRISSAVMDDDETVWLLVNYDDLCYSYSFNSHCWSIFRYEPDSGEMRELVSHEELDSSSVPQILMTGGRLLIQSYNEGHTTSSSMDCVITEIDKETGAEREVLRGDYSGVSAETGDTLVLFRYENMGDDKIHIKYFEADLGSGEVHELVGNEADRAAFICGDSIAWYETGDDGVTTVSTDYYTLQTDVKGIRSVWGGPDSISMIVDGYNTNYLYQYDIGKRECCIMKIDGFGSNSAPAGNGLISCATMSSFSEGQEKTTGTVFYIVPRLGTAFRLCRIGYYNGGQVSDGRFVFTERKEYNYGYYSDAVEFVEVTSGSNKLYWIDIS